MNIRNVLRWRERDAVMIVCIAAVFVLAIVYSVYSTTIDTNITTVNVSSTNVYASSTVQATYDSVFYANLSAGASTNTPTTVFNVTGSGYLTGGLGVGFATTGTGQLHITGLGVFERRVGVNGTTSPSVEFGVTGSGLVSGGFGVGYATTSGLKVSGLAVLNDRLGVNGTTSPYQEAGVTGDVAASSAATTTISVDTTSATQTGCIELQNTTTGRWVRIYPGNGGGTSTTAFMMSTSNLTSAPGAAALLVVELGRCQ